MKISRWLPVVLFLITLQSVAQTNSAQKKILSTWTAYGRQFTTLPLSGPIKQTPTAQTIAILTPAAPIVVRRIEAFSLLGPRQHSVTHGLQEVSPAKPCPKQFFIIVTNGTVTQSIPMSDKMFIKGSGETYTDSGELSVPFPAGAHIALSVLVPDIEPPAPPCGAYDVTINVQYETALPTQPKQTASNTQNSAE